MKKKAGDKKTPPSVKFKMGRRDEPQPKLKGEKGDKTMGHAMGKKKR
jgi:hypothetical protein